jgi:hypothetical protein
MKSSTWHFGELSFRVDVWEDDIRCHLSPLHLGTINDIISSPLQYYESCR